MQRKKTVGAELHSIGNLMKRIDSSCVCRYRRMTDLTEMQTRVVGFLFLHREKDIFQKDIEKEFSIRRPTVSILLQTMEAKGLIERESVPYDARLKKVLLTEEAEEQAILAGKEVEQFERMLTEGIDPGDLEIFFRVTEGIRGNLEKNFIRDDRQKGGMTVD